MFQENREKQTDLNQRDQSSSEMADLDNIGVTVELHVYDLTKGLAASLSQMLLGKAIFGAVRTKNKTHRLDFR